MKESIHLISLGCAKNRVDSENILGILKKVLLVAGCLAPRYRYDLLKRIPEVDAIVSPDNIHRIAAIIKECLTGKKVASIMQNYNCPGLMPRQLTASPHSVYLKIADGCNHSCKFCIIPQLRGKYRSKPMEALVKEARELAEQGPEK